VSKWQEKIDWESVKKSGIDFVIIRVGYRTDDKGTICEDPYAAYNLQKAEEYGIKIGVYFFSTAVNQQEATEEADWTTEYVSKYPITYPIIYNCEGFNESTSRMYGLTNAERTDCAIAFMDAIRDAGYETMLYAAKNELENSSNWDTKRIESNYGIWVANYSGTPYPTAEKPQYTGMYSMWQYTNKAVVTGILERVDLNVAYFSYDSIAQPKDTNGVVKNADTAELGMLFQDDNQQVTAKEQTNLRTAPYRSADIVAALNNGDFVTRTGVSESGWSRITYNGQVVYALTQLLTTDVTPATTANSVEAGISFEEVNEQVTPKEETNLRVAPNASSAVADTIKNGTVVTRTGKGNNGWSRVVYNGRTLYAVTSLLTTDFSATTKAPEATTITVSGMEFKICNDSVTAKSETNLRTAPSTDGSTVVSVLKKGDYATRTAVSSSGWSQLNYNGQTVYAISSYLTN
jgi:uncharacterized protein YgiM (DUF1202 family)